MPPSTSEVFEDGIDLQIGLLEAFVPTSRADWPGYPFPALRPNGEQEMRTFRTVILENSYLRATVLPGMGGRIISLFDKRTGTEILRRHPMIEPQAGGRRGALVREGIQIVLDGEERLNALGNVATQLDHPAEEDDDAAVWIAETVTGTGLSFHLRISLPPDRAELKFEVRVLNRWFVPQVYSGGLSIYLGEGSFIGSPQRHFRNPAIYCPDRRAGLALFSDGARFDQLEFENGVMLLSRMAGFKEIAPRQADTWGLTLVPISGLDSCLSTTRDCAVEINADVIRIQTTEQRLGHKLVILTRDKGTLEAVVDLYPEHIFEIPLEGLVPRELVLLDRAKGELIRAKNWPPERVAVGVSIHDVVKPPVELLGMSTPPGLLQGATFDISKRHVAHTLLGMRALKEKRFADAGLSFESALNYNADDPLLWWAKALAARLDDQDNQAELLNAHYLAPLEPALRAESFLAQPVSLDSEPNRLLAPLEENAEEFIEVACLLIECGLFDQASRWIDEALRHRDLPMLRYLMAYCLVSATRLTAEASDQVRIAAKSPVAPPFPYREVERDAIKSLHEAFPDDKNLAVFWSLLGI